jgi:hypothetical protein
MYSLYNGVPILSETFAVCNRVFILLELCRAVRTGLSVLLSRPLCVKTIASMFCLTVDSLIDGSLFDEKSIIKKWRERDNVE